MTPPTNGTGRQFQEAFCEALRNRMPKDEHPTLSAEDLRNLVTLASAASIPVRDARNVVALFDRALARLSHLEASP